MDPIADIELIGWRQAATRSGHSVTGNYRDDTASCEDHYLNPRLAGKML